MAAPKKLNATVISIIRYSDSVIEYQFKPEGRIPSFKPGQFLHLALDPYDPSQNWPDSRVFSIANAPEANQIRIVISVKGKFTTRMATELMVGSIVWLKFPYGNFTFESSGKHLVLIAGGTGISPYISFLEKCLDIGTSPGISLYYGVKDEKLIIFKEILQKCAETLPLFYCSIFCERPSINHMKLFNGIIDFDQILNENPHDSLFYISGPPLMIIHGQNKLRSKGISIENTFIDNW